jgi:hypothetical protein
MGSSTKTKRTGHFNDVLIALERKYGKDDYVLHLKKKLSDSETEKGVLRSELDECLYKLKQVKKEFDAFKHKTKHEQMDEVLQESNAKKNRTIRKHAQRIKELECINEQHEQDKMELRLELYKSRNK